MRTGVGAQQAGALWKAGVCLGGGLQSTIPKLTVLECVQRRAAAVSAVLGPVGWGIRHGPYTLNPTP